MALIRRKDITGTSSTEGTATPSPMSLSSSIGELSYGGHSIRYFFWLIHPLKMRDTLIIRYSNERILAGVFI